MLAIFLMTILAINGGLFAGIILHSAYKTARYEHIFNIAEKIWSTSLFS